MSRATSLASLLGRHLGAGGGPGAASLARTPALSAAAGASAGAAAAPTPSTSRPASTAAAASPARKAKRAGVLITPEEAAALSRQAFASSPASLPTLTGRRGPGPTVVGRITRLAGPWAWVDAGLKRPARLARAELKASQLVLSIAANPAVELGGGEEGGEAAPAAPAPPLDPLAPAPPAPAATTAARVRSPDDVRLGDALRFHVAAFATPYGGEPLLAPDALPRGGGPAPAAARLRSAWREITAAAAARTPVPGRILNVSGIGGYAVGIGGFVAFMPFSRADQGRATRAVGVLQPFYVLAAGVLPGGGAAGGGGRVNIVVSDAPTNRRRLLVARAEAARKAAGLPPAPGEWWMGASAAGRRREGGGEAARGGAGSAPWRPRQEGGEGAASADRLPANARRAAAGRPPRRGE